MKYDDASWHYGGNFPAGLPESAGATHMAMFVAWALLRDLSGPIHLDDFVDQSTALRERELSPGEWFLQTCDGKFTDEDLSDIGNEFASTYYAGASGLFTTKGSYLVDYAETFPDSVNLYDVPDTWSTFDTLAPVLDARLRVWKR